MDAQLERFFRAWCAPELDLLGFRVEQPYCLGMALLLEAIDSPFTRLHEGPDISPRDLLIALDICQKAKWPYRFVKPAVDAKVVARLEGSQAECDSAAADFAEWLSECSGRPEYWQEEGDDTAQTLTAPALLAQATTLLKKLHLTEERVWSMPLGLVSWYQGAIAEQDGAPLRFFYESEISEENNPPDISGMTDDELFEVVKTASGEAFALQWRAKREAAKCPA